MFIEEKGIIIGSDESLKGDTFGGIVVAAVKADDQMREKLIKLGVRDSKHITYKKILWLTKKIEKMTDCVVKNIFPEEYNSFKKGQTQLLNKLHQECYDYLKPGKHIVDKFPGCKVGDIIKIKADSKYVEVAAASILARAHGFKQIDNLSRRAGFKIPRGSTHVQAALEKIKKRNLDPKFFVKMDFKNVRNFLSQF